MELTHILEKHNLTDTGATLNGREHVHVVLAPDGKKLLLKTARIEQYQVRLLLAGAIDADKRSFKTQRLYFPEEGIAPPAYLLLEYVEGQELKTLYATDLPKALAISRAICDDYQELIRTGQAAGTLPQHVDIGYASRWLGRVFQSWIERIIQKDLLTTQEALALFNELFQLAIKNPQQFFGFTHGNIHGEHVILDHQERPHLLDLTIEPRPGAAIYDRLRVLDFILLEHPKPEEARPVIIEELREIKKQYNPDIVEAVWSLRCIGLLGADILGNEKRMKDPQYAIRERIALAMIRHQY